MEISFFIKKIISFFIEPMGMVLTLFVFGMYYFYIKNENRAEKFLLSALAVLFLFSYPPFSNFLVENLEKTYSKYDYKQDVKYIHVLGSGHGTDAQQPISSQICSAGVKRVIEGIILHKKIDGSKLIFTGFAGDTNTSNALMNKRLALELGVDEKNIILGEEPKDTIEEAKFTKKIVNVESFILVTSATHMVRAMEIFKSQGMNPLGAPTNFYKEEFSGYLRVPTIKSLENSRTAIHEYYGILYLKLTHLFN